MRSFATMRALLLRACFLMAGSVLFAPPPVVYAGGMEHLSPMMLLERVAAHGAHMRTLHAEFTQEKHMALLSRPLRSEGYFCLRRISPGAEHRPEDSLLWAYTRPMAGGFLYRAGRGYLWEATPTHARRADGREGAVITAMVRHVLDWIHINPGALSAAYRLEMPDPKQPALHLFPLRPSFFTRMTVTFTPDHASVQRLVLVERNGDEVRLQFSRTHINEPLPQQCAQWMDGDNGH